MVFRVEDVAIKLIPTILMVIAAGTVLPPKILPCIIRKALVSANRIPNTNKTLRLIVTT